MIKSEEGFATFDLSKTRKFDRKKDQEFLRQSFYKLATQYFEVSFFIFSTKANITPSTIDKKLITFDTILKSSVFFNIRVKNKRSNPNPQSTIFIIFF